MPNTLPVPSKAALRTLRSLALGTSCTVAFTTGLLTEDRRRRIHAAREVHTNAKKLKSSRKYHSAGSTSAESFEEQVMRYRDDGFWQANDFPKTIEPAQTALPLESNIPQLADTHQKQQFSFRISRHGLLNSSATKWKPIPAILQVPDLHRVPSKPPEIDKRKVHNRQQKLASDIKRLLEGKEDSSNVEAAAVRLVDAFEEGLPVEGSGLRKELIDAAVELSLACQLEQRFEARHKILDIILEHGLIDEDTFFSLGAERTVREMIKGPHDQATGHHTVEDSKLRNAAALYLTKFKEKPKIATDTWRCLGETLCATTCRQGLFDLTEALYWRVDQCRGDAPNPSVNHLMTAFYKQGRYKKVITIFRRFFASTTLNKSSFFEAGDMVIESSLQVRRLDIAEEALGTLAKMSEDLEVCCPSRWFMKVLRSDWENYRDISRTRAFFERLTLNFWRVQSPQAVYGAIIQFCIEAGDETAAQSYWERLQEAHGSLDSSGVRILGHFAYAKAIRNDWAGVKEDFQKMWTLDPCSHDYGASFKQYYAASFKENYSASFVPVFTLFAKNHSVNETEEFLRTFIDYHNIILKPYMSTTMITKYAEAHEIESISRWLDYMISVGSPPDPMFFNAIISNCRKKWKFSFEETYGLYHQVRKTDGPTTNFINGDTFSILRGIAIAEAGRDIASATRNLNRLKLDHPIGNPVDSRTVQKHMALALARGNPQRALRVYERAQNNNVIPLEIGCINTAVKASLQVDPNDIYAAASLLRKPQIDGLDISAAVATVFIHQMSYQCSGAKQMRVRDIARNTITKLEERGITVRAHVITHTMRTLVYQGQYCEATAFWDSMSQRQNTPMSLDLPTLTVLLQAYVGLHDCVGVEWAIQMLSINGLVPDETFQRPLKNTLREIRRLSRGECGPSERQFYIVIKNALQSVSAMRLEATKDKDDFKVKTIKIMEKAIEFQKKTDLDACAERSGRSALVSQASDDPELSEGSSRACEPDYHVDTPPVGRLVGVNAG